MLHSLLMGDLLGFFGGLLNHPSISELHKLFVGLWSHLPLVELAGFFGELSVYVQNHISSIPFSISFTAAMALSFMYVSSLVSGVIIRSLLVPMWIFVGVTSLFPSLIPPEYEFLSLMLFGAMVFVTFILLKHRKGFLRMRRRQEAAHRIITWMKGRNYLRPDLEIGDNTVERGVVEVLRDSKLS